MQTCGKILELVLQVLSWPLLQILVVCVLFGGFGGCVAHWINNEKQRLTTRASASQAPASQAPSGGKQTTPAQQDTWFLYPSTFQSAGIGIAGAIAFLFFIIAVGGLTNFQTLTEQLRSMAVSVIAGFGARSLLPRMVGHLEKQMAEVKNEAEQASHDAKEALGKAEDSEKRLKETELRLHEAEGKLGLLELNRKLVIAAQKKASADHVEEALHLFERAKRDGTARSYIWINGARVQRWHVSLDEAIKTLDAVLAAFDARELEKDANYPAAYYNRGCYYWLRFMDSKNPSDLEQAIRDLDASLRNAKDPAAEIAEMIKDPDLEALVNTESFQKLAAGHGVPGRGGSGGTEGG